MERQKRVAAIHDISGFGKCSLTVALPIISAAGIECCVLPTAVLSTHTGGFEGYTFRDLTEDIRPISQHWQSLNLKFDAIYSGFLGSQEQIELVEELFAAFKTPDNIIMVDPVMADNGEFYAIYSPSMATGMARLCQKADIIVPNLTEAAFILGEKYTEGPYDTAYIEHLLKALADLGPKQVVLTGVYQQTDKLGAACYNKETGEINYAFSSLVPGNFHGTGDVFGSFLLSAILNGQTLVNATQFAVDLTHDCICRTKKRGTVPREGVDFENVLPKMIKKLGLPKD